MAEFHILGQLLCATKFDDRSSIFCRYSFQAGMMLLCNLVNAIIYFSKLTIYLLHSVFEGPNWTIVSGCPEGQTVSAKLDYDKTVVWAHPLDIHYVTKGIQGMFYFIFV